MNVTVGELVFGLMGLVCVFAVFLLIFWSRWKDRAEARTQGQRLKVTVTEVRQSSGRPPEYRVTVSWTDPLTQETCAMTTNAEVGRCPFTKGNQIFIWLAANRLSAYIDKNQNP